MTPPADNHQVAQRIRAFVAQNILYNMGGATFSDEASFLREGIIDSLGVVELVAFVRKDFGIPVAQHEVTPENFDSVARLASFVGRKLAAHPASLPG